MAWLEIWLTATQGHSNWHHSKAWYGFLFAFYSNYGRIFSRLWDIQRQKMAWPWKLGKDTSRLLKWRRSIDILHLPEVGEFSHNLSISPSGKTTDRIKNVSRCKNGSDLLYHHAKFGWDCGSRASCREKVLCFLSNQIKSNEGFDL